MKRGEGDAIHLFSQKKDGGSSRRALQPRLKAAKSNGVGTVKMGRPVNKLVRKERGETIQNT